MNALALPLPLNSAWPSWSSSLRYTATQASRIGSLVALGTANVERIVERRYDSAADRGLALHGRAGDYHHTPGRRLPTPIAPVGRTQYAPSGVIRATVLGLTIDVDTDPKATSKTAPPVPRRRSDSSIRSLNGFA